MSARLCLALDVPDAAAALSLARTAGEAVDMVKVGLELFTREGPEMVRQLRGLDRELFLDCKFHDIPATVRSAVRQAGGLDVALCTLHVCGGERMVAAALEGRRESGGSTRLLGVTLLTSLTGGELDFLNPGQGPGWAGREGELVMRLADRARAWGLDGVVCSPWEAAAIKAACGPAFLCVTPGIRRSGDAAGDQRRAASPAEAAAAGADVLVVGRPIRDAADPAAAAREIRQELRAASGLSREKAL